MLLLVPPNPDSAWLLHAGARVLDGAHLGRELIEINPPLIVWMHAGVVGIARVLDADPAQVLHGGFALILAVVVAWSAALLPPDHAVARRPWLPVLIAFCLAVLPTSESGQREHLAAALTLPWLLLVARNAAGQPAPGRQAVAAGMLAGLGLALKPFFLIVPLMIAAGLALAGVRSFLRRPEWVGLAGLLACYAVSVPLLAPDFLPFAWRWYPVYAGVGRMPFADLASVAGARPLVAVALLAGGIAIWRRRRPSWSVELVLGLAAVGFGLAAALQGKAWSYPWLPAAILGWLGIGLAAARPAPSSRGSRLGRAALVLALGAAALAYTGRWLWWGNATHAYEKRLATQPLTVTLRALPPAQPVAGFSFSHGLGFPVVEFAGARWSLRVNSFQFLAGGRSESVSAKGLADGSPPRGAAEHELVMWVRQDLLADPPALLVDDFPAWAADSGRTSLLQWLRNDPVIDSVLSGYGRPERVEDLVLYWPTADSP